MCNSIPECKCLFKTITKTDKTAKRTTSNKYVKSVGRYLHVAFFARRNVTDARLWILAFLHDFQLRMIITALQNFQNVCIFEQNSNFCGNKITHLTTLLCTFAFFVLSAHRPRAGATFRRAFAKIAPRSELAQWIDGYLVRFACRRIKCLNFLFAILF